MCSLRSSNKVKECIFIFIMRKVFFAMFFLLFLSNIYFLYTFVCNTEKIHQKLVRDHCQQNCCVMSGSNEKLKYETKCEKSEEKNEKQKL